MWCCHKTIHVLANILLFVDGISMLTLRIIYYVDHLLFISIMKNYIEKNDLFNNNVNAGLFLCH